ncbi:MAG: hypothetical protein AMXMBFR7_07120 [Planctomycetota bacterium]
MSGTPESLEAPPSRLWNQRTCIALGAMLMTGCTVIGFAGVFATSAWVEWESEYGWPQRPAVHYAGTIALLAFPPLVALGGLNSWQAFRMAIGARKPGRLLPLALAVLGIMLIFLPYAGVLLTPLLFMLTWQSMRRQTTLIENQVGWMTPIAYLALWCGTLSMFSPTTRFPEDTLGGLLWASLIWAWFTADCLIVNIIALLNRQERLEYPESFRVQFSLKTLLTVTLLLAAYATLLVNYLDTRLLFG